MQEAPVVPQTFTGMILQAQQTAAIPMLLLVFAAMTPAIADPAPPIVMPSVSLVPPPLTVFVPETSLPTRSG
jgi:hypothetical protein